MIVNGCHRDVVIGVPAAVGPAGIPLPGSVEPTAHEIVQMQTVMLRELREEIRQHHVAAAQVVHVGIALAAFLLELGHGIDVDTVVVPVALRDRYEGGHITIDQGPDRSYVIRIRMRGEPEDVSIATER